MLARGPTGVIVAAIGVLSLLAGMFDVCVFAPHFGCSFSGITIRVATYQHLLPIKRIVSRQGIMRFCVGCILCNYKTNSYVRIKEQPAVDVATAGA